jgi:ATPase subunit of ABC transporter with duplicated ATPase domains
MNLYDAMMDAILPDERLYSSWRVDLTLDAFKAPNHLRQKSIKELSGGWQRLALIARIVLSNPDVLLLDEPTNHMDITKILLLEKWLNEQVYNIPLMTISHDRHFLENCTSKTLFLRGNELREYHCAYGHARTLLTQDDNALATKRSKELKEMNRLKRSAHELRQIGVNNYSDAALKKSIQIAKRAEILENELTTIHVEEKRNIKLSNSGILAKRLILLENIDICAPDSTHLFHIQQLDIREGERLMILGPNGCGKSQFLHFMHKTILDKDNARQEGVGITPTVKLGYIDQHLSHLPLEKTLREYFECTFSINEQKIIQTLITAGFPIVSHNTKLDKLSNGQRARVAFLALHLLQPNLYIMDEPTNHLDIAGQEQLEAEILEQKATSIFVSHDCVFSQSIGTKFYQIKNKQLIEINNPNVFYSSI